MKSLFIDHKLKTFLVFMLLCLTQQTAFAVDISVSVDRNPVTVDESFNIYFTATESPDGEPDFTPLAQDFTVVNQSQSSNSSWVNGQYSKSVRWTVQAIAKKAGNVTIPAIIFGNDTSKPLTITVNGGINSDNGASSDQEIFIQVKADPESPYVQSQILYSVRIYRRVDLTQARLSEPELTDAVIEKLGNDSDFSTVINGVSYMVTERKYAIFPQKSGELNIKPLTLTADVVMEDNRRDPFGGFFGSPITKTKRILSNEIKLNVKPAPASFNGKNWLPAEKLELAQTWSGDIQQMKIGEPITRTLTLRGVGTPVSQLPELNTLKTDNLVKTYPDQPALNEEKLPDGISASRQEKIALIPSTPGKHTLPAIEIPWFNTKTQRLEVAKIAETTINVIGGNVANQDNAAASAQSQNAPLAPTQTNTSTAHSISNAAQSTSTNKPEMQATWWPWLSLFLGLGWLSSLAYIIYNRRNSATQQPQADDALAKATRLKDINKQLKNACQQNDSLAAKNILLLWGKQQFNVSNLGALAAHCEARLRDEIQQLNQHLYSQNQTSWDGKKLYQCFSENNARQKLNQVDDVALEPLHRL